MNKRRRIRWKIVIPVLLIALGIFLIHPAITTCCWMLKLPRTEAKLFSPLAEPIRSAFTYWDDERWDKEFVGPLAPVPPSQKLLELINQELPRGSNLADVERHLKKHYRVEATKVWHPQSGYVPPSFDTYHVYACEIPRTLWSESRLLMRYVTFQDEYLYTDVRLVGSKGHTYREYRITPQKPGVEPRLKITQSNL